LDSFVGYVRVDTLQPMMRAYISESVLQ